MRAIDTLEPSFKPKIEQLLSKLSVDGINCVVTSGRRTIAEQDKLYTQGRAAPGKIVTKAKGGQSPHNFGLAADLCPLKPGTSATLWWNAPDDVWNAMHRLGEECGLRAGYDFTTIKDNPHFEASDWKHTQGAWLRGEITVA